MTKGARVHPPPQVMDASGNIQYFVSGNSCQFGPNCICQSFDFDILKADGTHTGAYIKNIFPGCGRMFTKADNLMVTFPADADPAHRAALMGVTLLIDYMYFEQRNKDSNGNV